MWLWLLLWYVQSLEEEAECIFDNKAKGNMTEMSTLEFWTSMNAVSGGPLYLLCGMAALSVLWVYVFRWHTYATALRTREIDEVGEGEEPRMAIVVVSHEQAGELEKNLPYFLGQHYGRFEVVVVDMASTDYTTDVIKRLEKEHPRLRHTFVPESARHVERRKLAVTLGIRAARAEWVVVVEADCAPASQNWLATLATRCTESNDLVLAYSNYEDDGSFASRFAIYERLRRQFVNLQAIRNCRAIDAESVNICYRKEFFLQMNGFSNSLTLPFGEEALFVDAYAKSRRIAFAMKPEVRLEQALPADNSFGILRVRLAEVNRRKRAFAQFMRFGNASVFLFIYIYILVVASFVAIRLRQWDAVNVYDMQWLAPDCIMGGLLLVVLLLPVNLLERFCKQMGEDELGMLPLVFALCEPWRNIAAWIVCRFKRRRFVRDFG